MNILRSQTSESSAASQEAGNNHAVQKTPKKNRVMSFFKNINFASRPLNRLLLAISLLTLNYMLVSKKMPFRSEVVTALKVDLNKASTLKDQFKDGVVAMTTYNRNTHETSVKYLQVLSEEKRKATLLGGRETIDFKNEEKSFQQMSVDRDSQRKLSQYRFSTLGGVEDVDLSAIKANRHGYSVLLPLLEMDDFRLDTREKQDSSETTGHKFAQFGLNALGFVVTTLAKALPESQNGRRVEFNLNKMLGGSEHQRLVDIDSTVTGNVLKDYTENGKAVTGVEISAAEHAQYLRTNHIDRKNQ